MKKTLSSNCHSSLSAKEAVENLQSVLHILYQETLRINNQVSHLRIENLFREIRLWLKNGFSYVERIDCFSRFPQGLLCQNERETQAEERIESFVGEKNVEEEAVFCSFQRALAVFLEEFPKKRNVWVADKLMVEASRFSRALKGVFSQKKQEEHLKKTYQEGYLRWEYLLNSLILSWQENDAKAFLEAALALEIEKSFPQKKLDQLLLERHGCPIIPLKGPRFGVEICHADKIPPKRSLLEVHYKQLMGDLQGMQKESIPSFLGEIEKEAGFYLDMLQRGVFYIVSLPRFLHQHGRGREILRGEVGFHPFLENPRETHKKALLLANKTYHPDTEATSAVYLQVAQFYRLLKLRNKSYSWKIKNQTRECLLFWEENCLPKFCQSFLQLALCLTGEKS